MSIHQIMAALIMSLLSISAQATEVIAHRGASFAAPENTLAAVKLAWTYDSDAVEVDVHLTKDNKIVVIHDANLERTGRRAGEIAKMTWTELKNVDVGSWKGPEWANQTIPTLESVIDTVPEGKRLFIEIKCGPEIIPHLQNLLLRKKVKKSQAVIISFDGQTLFEAKQKMPDFPMYHLRIANYNQLEGRWLPTINKVAMAKHMGFDGINIGYNGPVKSKGFISLLHQLRTQSRDMKLKYYSWTINDEDVAKGLIAAGVDGITTDHPDKVKALLRQR